MKVIDVNDFVFAVDELKLRDVKPEWTVDELLTQEAIFFLKDCAHLLKIDSVRIKKQCGKVIKKRRDPWKVMGVRKIWNHWLIRMKVFAPYYKKHFFARTHHIPDDWDGNDILSQQGLFGLADVCKLLPLSPQQVRYQAKRRANPREEIGVWKDEGARGYVVHMAVFGPWFRTVWGNAVMIGSPPDN